MNLAYVTCDVFTHEAFGGNQLAVVFDADDLTSEQMQKIASEFNYSETTFVSRPKDPKNTACVRIFTPNEELPFAGHPNVGTAVALAHSRPGTGQGPFIFEELAGLVPLDLSTDDDVVSGAILTSPEVPTIGPEADVTAVADALGVDVGALCFTHHKPLHMRTGLHFLMIEVNSLEDLAHSKSPSLAQVQALGTKQIYVYCRNGSETAVQARMFAPELGIVEDPATGGAAVFFAALQAELLGRDGQFNWIITQGVEMGRPSRLHATVVRENGKTVKIMVRGDVVMMMEGTLAYS